MIKSHQKFLNMIFIGIDCIVFSISLLIAWYVRFTFMGGANEGRLGFSEYMIPLIFIIPLFIVIYDAFGLYGPHRVKKLEYEVISIIKAYIVGTIIIINILFLIKEIHYSRYVLLLFTLIGVMLSIIERISLRLILRNLRKGGYNIRHILIIGAGELGCSFASKIELHKHLGYNIVGFLDDEKKNGYRIKNAEVIGGLNDLTKVVNDNDLDEIVIAIPLKQYDKLQDIIKICEKLGVKAQIIPDYYKFIPARPYVDQLDDLPIINIRYIPLDDAFNKLVKRLMDITISLVGIVITSPILLTSAILIKVTSPGPVIFNQQRVGMHRRNFNMYKFRSMKVQRADEEKVQWTTKNDPRKTKFGEFIRKTSIDELPQLFNVLKGDMSIIGPRPERPYFVDKFKEEIPKYMIKHHVRPGITGWAQVNGYRGDTSIEGRINHDIYYIENWNVWLDIKIIFMTLYKGFVNKNAY